MFLKKLRKWHSFDLYYHSYYLFIYWTHNLIFSSKAVLEIHDELAAQIQNSTEAVEYIDGVSSIAEEDDLSTLMSIQEDKSENGENKKDDEEEEEVQIDTFRVIGVRRSPGESLVRGLSHINVHIFGDL